MTQTEQDAILRLRDEGAGYKKIATETGVPLNTVKSFLRRQPVPAIKSGEGIFCRQCGVKLVHSPHRKKKTFCSDACRMAWWNAHPELVQRKAIYHLTCAHCGAEFESYGNARRKYCSCACYGKARSKAVKR